MPVVVVLIILIIGSIAIAANWTSFVSALQLIGIVLLLAVGGFIGIVLLETQLPKWKKRRHKQEQQREHERREAERLADLVQISKPSRTDFERQLRAKFSGPANPHTLDFLVTMFGDMYERAFHPPSAVPSKEAAYPPHERYLTASLRSLNTITAALPAGFATSDTLVEERKVELDAGVLTVLRDAFRDMPYLSWADARAGDLTSDTPEGKEYWLLSRAQQTAVGPFTEYATKLVKHTMTIPLQLPQKERFEGAWMVAPSGSGKTNALLYLIKQDLDLVAAGKASVIVIDSSGAAPGRLLHYLSRYQPFKDRLRDKLVVLEPSYDHPLALNLFDVDMERIQTLPADDRMAALSSARSMIEYVLSGLLGSEMTDKQQGTFGYLVEALMHIPGATIFTLAQLLTDEGYDAHREHILRLDPHAADFFENRFRQKYQQRGSHWQPLKNAFAGTKQELYWRIDKMLKEPVFRRMFSHPRNKLDMFAEMQAGKLILINTNKTLMQEDGAETFGRFMIAKIYQAAERRLSVAQKENLPVYVYIDECHDYIRNEPRIVKLLDQLARKNNIAFIFAHQRPANLSTEVLDAVSTTAIRFASRSEQEAAFIAQRLRLEDPATLSNLDQGQFAYLFREHKGTRSGIAKFPLMDLPLMSEDDYAPIRDAMRERYSAPPMQPVPLAAPADTPDFDDEESTRGDPDFR